MKPEGNITTIAEQKSTAWYVRPIRPEDEEAFLSFLSAWVTNVSLKDRYAWMYQNNPHGKALTWLAVTSQGNVIVGCTSVFPRKMWIHGRLEMGSAGGDTYVDPGWRRKGIAVALHKASAEGMRENGIRLEYGFPLVENLQAFCKAGAYLPGPFMSAKCFLSLRPFLKKLGLARIVPGKALKALDRVFLRVTKPGISSPVGATYDVSEIDRFDQSFETLTEELRSFFKICCVRDSSYLRWRFLDNPFRDCALLKVERNRDARLYGFAAIEILGEMGHVYEFFVRPEDGAVDALLTGLMRFGVSRSLSSLSLVINPKGRYSSDFARHGFRFNHSDQRMLEALGDYGRAGLADLENWYLAGSDLDL